MRTLNVFLLLIWATAGWGKPLAVRVSAESALLMNAETGAILYEKRPHALQYPASLTKIASSLYVLEKKKNQLDEMVFCDPRCLRKMRQETKAERSYRDAPYLLEPDGSHFSILPGERLRLKDLMYGMMVASGNDASNVVAQHVEGSIPAFMRHLNAYIEKLGCKNTQFMNPHGLHHPQHRTTAFDLALIVRAALKNKMLCAIAGEKEYYRPKTNKQPLKMVKQKNKLLSKGKFFYEAAFGLKIGYTAKAGNTFAGVAREGGRTLIVILLSCPSSDHQYRDAIRLFDAAFEEKKVSRLLFNSADNAFECRFKGGKGRLRARLLEDISMEYFPSEEPEIKIELDWQRLPLPIEKGALVGQLRILNKEGALFSVHELYAAERLEQTAYAACKAFFSGTSELSLTARIVLLALLFTLFAAFLYLMLKPKRQV